MTSTISTNQLLKPIDPDAPSGVNLQYDAIFDQIAEARTEDDPTIPSGEWSRPAKRMDTALVLSITRSALELRSKDLWLAAWFGEATLKSEGLSALPSILHLLLQLQEHFWDTLYPKPEGGDLGARSAPLQWALTQYTRLLQDLPLLTATTSLQEFRRSRLPSAAQERELVDAALASTSKSALFATDSLLVQTLDAVQSLQQFCDERFGEDGPAFVALRSVVEEAQNTARGLLRQRRETHPGEPEPLQAPGEPSQPTDHAAAVAPVPELSADQTGLTGPSPQTVPWPARPTIQGRPAQAFPRLPEAVDGTAEVQTPWTELYRLSQHIAEAEPTHPLGYLVIAALCWGDVQADAGASPAPDSAVRRTLLRLRVAEQWQDLLAASVQALASTSATAWLDPHFYVWCSATSLNSAPFARNSIAVVRSLLGTTALTLNTLFDDGTPLATPETRQWIEDQVLGTSPPAGSAAATPRKTMANSSPGAAAQAAKGSLQSAVSLLSSDANGTNVRRRQFLSQREIASCCVDAAEYAVAARLLTRLLTELDTLQLEAWEGTDFAADLMVLLLRCPEEQTPEIDRQQLLHRLTLASPLRALELASTVVVKEVLP